MENNVVITVNMESGDKIVFDGFNRAVEEKLLTYLNTNNPTKQPIYLDYNHGVLSKVRTIEVENDNKTMCFTDPDQTNKIIEAMVVDTHYNLKGVNVLNTIEQFEADFYNYELNNKFSKEYILGKAVDACILDNNPYAKQYIIDLASKDTDTRLISYLAQPEFVKAIPEIAPAIRSNEEVRKIVMEQIEKQEREQPKQYSRFQLNYIKNLSNIDTNKDANKNKGKDI